MGSTVGRAHPDDAHSSRHAAACANFEEMMDVAMTLNQELAKRGLQLLDDEEVFRRTQEVCRMPKTANSRLGWAEKGLRGSPGGKCRSCVNSMLGRGLMPTRFWLICAPATL